ncbi:MAG: carboxynorspermidine decarboxylase, partial [Erysipelotrichaceae bacterium]
MFDLTQVETPCYVIDEAKLEANCRLLAYVQKQSGAKILLAQKAFSAFHTYPLLSSFLSGTTASGIHEARLAFEEFKKEVHVYAPAYKEEDLKELVHMADHIVFNSVGQLQAHYDRIKKSKKDISIGLRINPEYSEIEVELYNPCAPHSRFGIKAKDLPMDLSRVEGLHFHTLCEQGAQTLARTLKVVEERFGAQLSQMKWINFGGGHHITKEGYDVELLIQLIKDFKAKYEVDVYLEPGEAVALDAGYLV